MKKTKRRILCVKTSRRKDGHGAKNLCDDDKMNQDVRGQPKTIDNSGRPMTNHPSQRVGCRTMLQVTRLSMPVRRNQMSVV